MKKTYVLDTNVLLSDPTSISSFDDNDVIIPMIVLEELDNHKSRQDDVGKNARTVSRSLDDMRKIESLAKGVPTPGGGILRVVNLEHSNVVELPPDMLMSKVDNIIIGFMMYLKKVITDRPVILVTKDINVRLKCDSVTIQCEDYLKLRVAQDRQSFYRGVAVIETSEDLVDEFYIKGKVSLPDDIMSANKFFPNQIIVIKNVLNGVTTKSAITKFVSNDVPLVPIMKIDNAFGMKPKNKEQSFSLDLLYDDNIKLVTLAGPAGTGKTSLAIAAALDQLKTIGSHGKYDKVIITRPVQPLGKDIGFLPGTLEEKMDPWVSPFKDAVSFLMGSKKTTRRANDGKIPRDEYYLTLMQDKGLLEIEAITFIRGRSIPNAFIIIDEAQNISMHELKTIITRVGHNTKIVLTGDLEQIDNVHVDAYSNGLSYAIEKFKDYDLAGHITLIKGERSPLATLASQIL